MHCEYALLRADGLCKNFASGDSVVHALRDVSFEIYPGEFIVVLGPSGSGKSTMLNIIGGIESPSAGTVEYDGQALSAMNSTGLCTYRRKHVGFVFQFYNLMPGLSAYENVELAAELSTDPLDAKTLIAQVGLAGQTTFRARCQADSSSAWPSLVRSRRIRISCSVMSRPAPWTPRPETKSSGFSATLTVNIKRP